MMSMTIKNQVYGLTFFFLNKISNKFNAFALKTFVDKVFIIAEKFIVQFPRLLLLYVSYYSDIIDKEIHSSSITNNSKVLHVGCGSIPASCILIAKKTYAQVLGIDTDSNAVLKAKRCIQQLGYTKYISVRNTDALQIDLSKYNIILVSQGIISKQEFFNDLYTKITKNHIIILRSFSDTENLDQSDHFLYDRYFVCSVLNHKKNGSSISIILKKKN